MKRTSKYRSIPTVVDGIRFSSRFESERYGELKLLEKAGRIEGLRTQVRYELLAGDVPILIRSGRYKNGRKAVYIADFVYMDHDICWEIIEDTKGHRTAEYKLKKAIMEAMGYTITEITKSKRR